MIINYYYYIAAKTAVQPIADVCLNKREGQENTPCDSTDCHPFALLSAYRIITFKLPLSHDPTHDFCSFFNTTTEYL